MDQKIKVTLSAPAKVGGKIHAAGKELEVTAAELDHLKKAGAVGGKAFDAGVDLTDWKARALSAEARAIEAEAQRDRLQGRVLELQKETGEAVLRAEAAEAAMTTNVASDQKPEGNPAPDASAVTATKKATVSAKKS